MNIKTAFFNKFAKICAVFCAVCAFAVPAIAGRLPPGYTELTYIESDGTQWIQTNVTANNNSSAEVKFVPLSLEGFPAVFGARESKSKRAFNIWSKFGVEPYKMGINIGTLGQVDVDVMPQIGTEYTVSMSATNLTINGVSKSISGVSCLFGTMLAINPIIFIVCGIEWLIVALSSGKSSAGAIVVFCLYPILGFVMNTAVGWAFLAVSVLCFVQHRENIARLINGSESSVEWRWRK